MTAYMSLLRHRCAVMRKTATRDARTGLRTTYAEHLSGVRCRVEQLDANERTMNDQQVVATHRVFLPYGTDVQHEDRLSAVTDMRGVQIMSDADVEWVDRDSAGAGHHVELLVTEVR
jgi:head-tail adaptor